MNPVTKFIDVATGLVVVTDPHLYGREFRQGQGAVIGGSTWHVVSDEPDGDSRVVRVQRGSRTGAENKSRNVA